MKILRTFLPGFAFATAPLLVHCGGASPGDPAPTASPATSTTASAAAPTNEVATALSGTYVPSTPGSSAEFEALTFWDATTYTAERASCSNDCESKGTYTFDGVSDLELTDGVTKKVEKLEFHALTSTGSTTPQSLRALDGDGLLGSGGGGGLLGSDAGSLVQAASGALIDGTAFTDIKNALGNFTSTQCEPFDDSTYQIRHYTFTTSGAATATWDRYSDPTCSQASQLYEIVMTGNSSFHGLSTVALNTLNIIVTLSDRTLTPTDAGVPVLQAACSDHTFASGVTTDVPRGCGAIFQQTDDCMAEYDLMNISPAGMTFGDRSVPLCSADSRPTSLSAYSVVSEADPRAYVAP